MKKRNNVEPIEFEANSGKKFILIYEGVEYRAYELIRDNGRRELKLGSSNSDSLIKYIKERM